MLAPLAALPLLAPFASAAYSYYSLGNLPHTSEEGQSGYNDCGSTDSQSSMCQTAHINSVTDFCLWAPPTPGQEIGATEEHEVTWCTANGHGSRVMPAGTIKSAHYLKTPHYTQVTGTGDFTKINVKAGDQGGELDPHGATGLGNPIGSLVFNNGVQIHEWTSFISDTEFCFRVCHDASDAWLWCQHIYDVMGCQFNEPGNYGSGFDQCDGDSTTHPPGIYEGTDGRLSTFSQGNGHTPANEAPGKSSNCQAVATVGGQAVAVAATTTTAASSAAQSSSAQSSSSVLPSSASSSSASSSSVSSSSLASSSSVSSGSASSSDSAALSGSASSDVSGSSTSSGFSTLSASSTGANSTSSSAQSTITSTSTLSDSSAVSTGAQRAASTSASATSGSTRVVAGAVGSLVAVAGALAIFA
ncbi:hypothetical protein JCM10207_004209 [Rhodosporidiobolus poonsookiae]